jgi:signal recognition particle GTPase
MHTHTHAHTHTLSLSLSLSFFFSLYQTIYLSVSHARCMADYAGRAQGYDVVMIDTAGRMQDNAPLMRALAKVTSRSPMPLYP